MKATYASLSYGRGEYPVHEANLPDLPIEDAVATALRQMGKLSGGFTLDEPTFINVEIIGNGYVVRLNHEDEAFLGRALAEAEGAR